MKLYIPKWDSMAKKKFSKHFIEEDSLRFNSYEEKDLHGVNKYSVNWFLPGIDYIPNTLLQCNVFDVDEKVLFSVAKEGYVVIAIPLYDTVVYAVEALRNVTDMKDSLEYDIVYSNYIYFKA